MDKQTLSVEEAAEILGIGRNSAYRAARDGSLPTLRFGKRLVVPRQVIDRMLAGEHGAHAA
jgi:excisionase family DNA binding protein